jgi:hypothetical protein
MTAFSRRNALVGGGAWVIAGAGAAAFGYRRIALLDDYNAALAATRAALSANPSLQELVRFATLAPNGHNTQTWQFRVGTDRIDIQPDFARLTPVVDPDNHHDFVSLGAAAENLALASAARGYRADISFDPTGPGAVAIALEQSRPVDTTLFQAIRHRQSTRAVYDGHSVSATDLKHLVEAAVVPGVNLVMITDHAHMAKVTELVMTGNSAQMADPALVTELKRRLRLNPHDALAASDGLFSAASGSPVVPTWAGSYLFDNFSGAATATTSMSASCDRRQASRCLWGNAPIPSTGCKSAGRASGLRSRRPRLA